ncbi:hypothetical protein [Egbenema bharatensis]|uniref:hypothetical protein n=1 Tax=Egbenema bharatensis TaxID=3463334 RepID=UPI003A85D922
MTRRNCSWITAAIITIGLATYAQLLSTGHSPATVSLRTRSTFPGLLSTQTKPYPANPAAQWHHSQRKLQRESRWNLLQSEVLPSDSDPSPLDLGLRQTTRWLMRWHGWLNHLDAPQP